MHELHFVQSAVKQASALAVERSARAVSAIQIAVGEDSGYSPDNLAMYFDMTKAGTVCENAKLSFRIVKPVLQCAACGTKFERQPFSFACPACGGEGNPTEVGREILVEGIELDLGDEGS